MAADNSSVVYRQYVSDIKMTYHSNASDAPANAIKDKDGNAADMRKGLFNSSYQYYSLSYSSKPKEALTKIDITSHFWKQDGRGSDLGESLGGNYLYFDLARDENNSKKVTEVTYINPSRHWLTGNIEEKPIWDAGYHAYCNVYTQPGVLAWKVVDV